jgi:hypothetical protein
MSAYAAVEWLVIALLLLLSLRLVWRRVVAPALAPRQRRCGAGCGSCGADKSS